MSAVAQAFVDSLPEGLRGEATFSFGDAERFRWQYTPGRRRGVALSDMDAPARQRAMALMESGLSAHGFETATSIIRLEPVLRAIEERAGRAGSERRDAGHYWFSVFGDPSSDAPWAWRVGGHHLCLHFTVVDGAVAVTPLFFGANPARVPSGEHAGLRVLAAEEDLARAFLDCLDDGLRSRAVVSPHAPSDILTTNQVRAEIAAVPTGLARSGLPLDAAQALDALVDHYLGRVRLAVSVRRDDLTFAWAGSTTVGEGHYYAIRGDAFLIEYDNTQNGANHAHTVWRDVRRDWGEDLLAAHYAKAHRGK